MQRGAKRISNSIRPQIDNIKSEIRGAVRPFDGCGSAFKTALQELRAEGIAIKYVAEKCHYIKAN